MVGLTFANRMVEDADHVDIVLNNNRCDSKNYSETTFSLGRLNTTTYSNLCGDPGVSEEELKRAMSVILSYMNRLDATKIEIKLKELDLFNSEEVEMTLDEIEHKLGHRVALVDEKGLRCKGRLR